MIKSIEAAETSSPVQRARKFSAEMEIKTRLQLTFTRIIDKNQNAENLKTQPAVFGTAFPKRPITIRPGKSTIIA